MTVSRTAWHYRYLSKLNFSHPTRLCPYFWKLMFALLVPPAAGLFVLIAVSGVVYGLGWLIWHYPLQSALIVGAILSVIGVIFGAILTGIWLHRNKPWQQMRPLPAPVTETATLTGAYLHAAHLKVCPMIEFTD